MPTPSAPFGNAFAPQSRPILSPLRELGIRVDRHGTIRYRGGDGGYGPWLTGRGGKKRSEQSGRRDGASHAGLFFTHLKFLHSTRRRRVSA